MSIFSSDDQKIKHMNKYEYEEEKRRRIIKKFLLVTSLDIIFMFAEGVAGIISNSIVILTDALDLLSDFFGHSISLFSLTISRRPPTEVLTYGYLRADVIGAFGSLIFV